MGDALWAIHSMKVINENFLLVMADVLTEINVADLTKSYELHLEKTKPLLMLKVFYQQEKDIIFNSENSSVVIYYSNSMILK